MTLLTNLIGRGLTAGAEALLEQTGAPPHPTSGEGPGKAEHRSGDALMNLVGQVGDRASALFRNRDEWFLKLADTAGDLAERLEDPESGLSAMDRVSGWLTLARLSETPEGAAAALEGAYAQGDFLTAAERAQARALHGDALLDLRPRFEGEERKLIDRLLLDHARDWRTSLIDSNDEAALQVFSAAEFSHFSHRAGGGLDTMGADRSQAPLQLLRKALAGHPAGADRASRAAWAAQRLLESDWAVGAVDVLEEVTSQDVADLPDDERQDYRLGVAGLYGASRAKLAARLETLSGEGDAAENAVLSFRLSTAGQRTLETWREMAADDSASPSLSEAATAMAAIEEGRVEDGSQRIFELIRPGKEVDDPLALRIIASVQPYAAQLTRARIERTGFLVRAFIEARYAEPEEDGQKRHLNAAVQSVVWHLHNLPENEWPVNFRDALALYDEKYPDVSVVRDLERFLASEGMERLVAGMDDLDSEEDVRAAFAELKPILEKDASYWDGDGKLAGAIYATAALLKERAPRGSNLRRNLAAFEYKIEVHESFGQFTREMFSKEMAAMTALTMGFGFAAGAAGRYAMVVARTAAAGRATVNGIKAAELAELGIMANNRVRAAWIAGETANIAANNTVFWALNRTLPGDHPTWHAQGVDIGINHFGVKPFGHQSALGDMILRGIFSGPMMLASGAIRQKLDQIAPGAGFLIEGENPFDAKQFFINTFYGIGSELGGGAAAKIKPSPKRASALAETARKGFDAVGRWMFPNAGGGTVDAALAIAGTATLSYSKGTERMSSTGVHGETTPPSSSGGTPPQGLRDRYVLFGRLAKSGERIVLGRDLIDDPVVSRGHVHVELHDNGLLLTPVERIDPQHLGDSYGTWIHRGDGWFRMKHDKDYLLKPGQRVALGPVHKGDLGYPHDPSDAIVLRLDRDGRTLVLEGSKGTGGGKKGSFLQNLFGGLSAGFGLFLNRFDALGARLFPNASEWGLRHFALANSLDASALPMQFDHRPRAARSEPTEHGQLGETAADLSHPQNRAARLVQARGLHPRHLAFFHQDFLLYARSAEVTLVRFEAKDAAIDRISDANPLDLMLRTDLSETEVKGLVSEAERVRGIVSKMRGWRDRARELLRVQDPTERTSQEDALSREILAELDPAEIERLPSFQREDALLQRISGDSKATGEVFAPPLVFLEAYARTRLHPSPLFRAEQSLPHAQETAMTASEPFQNLFGGAELALRDLRFEVHRKYADLWDVLDLVDPGNPERSFIGTKDAGRFLSFQVVLSGDPGPDPVARFQKFLAAKNAQGLIERFSREGDTLLVRLKAGHVFHVSFRGKNHLGAMEKMRSRAAEIAGPDSTAMKTLDVYFDHLKAIYGRSDARTRGRMGERLAEIRDETKRAYGDPLLELEDGLIRMIQEFGR